VGLIGIWRHLGIAYKVPFWAQYYTPLYCMTLALIMETNWQIYRVLQPAGWLEIEKTREVILAAPAVVNITVWEDEASLEGYWPLIYFSLSAPLWMLGTFLICLLHTYVHAWQCRNEGLGSHKQRDLTIAFLALPVMYGMMSLRAVMDCWFVITNTSIGVHESWGELKDFFFQAFEANFLVADLYESLALLVFAQITMTVLRSRVMVLQRDDVETINNLHSLLATDEPGIRLAPSPSACTLSERTHEVLEALSATLLLSIKYFCCACGAQALYFLFITTFEYFGHPIQALSTAQSKATFRTFFLGMGFISSSAAIHSMVILEQSIGKRYLHGYNAAKKFMSAKVLVSLAFLQSLVMLLPPFSLLSETRQKLLYASTMCFECFLISIFHLTAWSTRERWFWESELAPVDLEHHDNSEFHRALI